MGMGRMFSMEAEFDNLLDSEEPICVSKVIHKAFIESKKNVNIFENSLMYTFFLIQSK
jgi:hypothetical protein